jgi:hypothetical protein
MNFDKDYIYFYDRNFKKFSQKILIEGMLWMQKYRFAMLVVLVEVPQQTNCVVIFLLNNGRCQISFCFLGSTLI